MATFPWVGCLWDMPLISEKELKASYDVIIVGSGAGGGQSAYTLTMNGVKVLLLEAGRN